MDRIYIEKNNNQLKFAHLIPETWEALSKVLRKGWVMHNVQNPESVQQHTIALKKIAMELADKLTTFSETEKEELLDMLEVHDWAEAIIGDEVNLTEDPEEMRIWKAGKFDREKQAMSDICSSLGEIGERVMRLWNRFETSEDQVASFARQLDKYQAIELAREYENTQGIPLFDEFHDYSIKHITHPLLLERIEKLKTK